MIFLKNDMKNDMKNDIFEKKKSKSLKKKNITSCNMGCQSLTARVENILPTLIISLYHLTCPVM